jgi:hypothetical protein
VTRGTTQGAGKRNVATNSTRNPSAVSAVLVVELSRQPSRTTLSHIRAMLKSFGAVSCKVSAPPATPAPSKRPKTSKGTTRKGGLYDYMRTHTYRPPGGLYRRPGGKWVVRL